MERETFTPAEVRALYNRPCDPAEELERGTYRLSRFPGLANRVHNILKYSKRDQVIFRWPEREGFARELVMNDAMEEALQDLTFHAFNMLVNIGAGDIAVEIVQNNMKREEEMQRRINERT